MAEQQIVATAWTPAPPALVYRLLRSGVTWPTWSPIDSFELERTGPDGEEGLGAIRLFHTGRVTSREEIVELVPDRRFSYSLLRGLPMRGYRADIDLEPHDGGTTIRWQSRFHAKYPATGGVLRRFFRRFLQRCVDGLAAHAAEAAERAASA
jgi:hypothetical protein